MSLDVNTPTGRRSYIAGNALLASILADVCKRYRLRVKDLMGPERVRYISYPRQEFMYLAYETGRFSYPTIGRFIGRDHATVIFGAKAHAARLAAQ